MNTDASTFADGGSVVYSNTSGGINDFTTTGDFATAFVPGGSSAGTAVTFTSPLSLSAPSSDVAVFTLVNGGTTATFYATSFSNFVDDTSGNHYSFDATGYFTMTNFNQTAGLLTFSTDRSGTKVGFDANASVVPIPATGVLLLGGLGGLAALKRRKRKAA